jgi:hypothetical protein
VSGNNDSPNFILFVHLLIWILNFVLIDITVMTLIIHIKPFVLQLLDGNIILSKPTALALQIPNITHGNIQKPNHNIKLLLIDPHTVIDPDHQHNPHINKNNHHDPINWHHVELRLISEGLQKGVDWEQEVVVRDWKVVGGGLGVQVVYYPALD